MPLSIFYQFLNYFNLYFLVSTVIFSIPELSSIDPASSIGPFALVIMISVIREGVEDYKKAQYDRLYNNYDCTRVEEGKLVKRKWNQIHVGDIIRVLKNEEIPADLVVFCSSSLNGYCYLETTNLDGESALKVKEAVGLTHNQSFDLTKIQATLSIDTPNRDIYAFEGQLKMTSPLEQNCFLKIENLLLRSGKLKNVDWVDGLVVYTGQDTKIMQNIK